MSDYPAIITRRTNGRFFARVPDLPGVRAAGRDAVDALAHVVEAAADYVRDMVSQGEAVPPPRDLAAVPHNPRVEEYGRTTVPVPTPAPTHYDRNGRRAVTKRRSKFSS